MEKEKIPVPPGSIIGLFGGGQLGRMAAMAAARLGYRCHIFTPDTDSPAAQVAMTTTIASYDDVQALRAFAATVDIATFEFENIPIESLQLVAEQIPVRPSWKTLKVAQDRVQEKTFFNKTLGLQTTPWRRVVDQDTLAQALAELGRPAILKTARFGYDGKGQIRIDDRTPLEYAWHHIGAEVGVLESVVDFTCELSVVVARGIDGAWAAFDPAENNHVNHVLQTSRVPARIPARMVVSAVEAGRYAADVLDVVGILAVEMFVTRKGSLLINEIAPRPHNSGHWTLDACVTDQFEQFIRAVCGLPLGSPARYCDAEMINLLGEDVVRWREILDNPFARLHLYGKDDARPGRKMGHVTYLQSRTGTDQVLSRNRD